jgi:hypothetical protein
MFSLKASDIYDVIKPLHFCSQLIGLTSFKIKKENDCFEAFYTIFNIIFISISSFFATSIYSYYLFNFEEMWNSQIIFMSDVFLKSLMVITSITLISIIIINWWTFFFRKHFVSIFNQLNSIDEQLKKLDVKLNLDKCKKRVFTATLFVFVSIAFGVVTMQISESGLYSNPFNIFVNLFILIELSQTQVLLPMQYIELLRALKIRHQKLIFIAENMFFASINGMIVKNDSNHPETREDKLRNIARIHDELVDVSETINRFYGVPVSHQASQIVFDLFRSSTDDADDDGFLLRLHFECFQRNKTVDEPRVKFRPSFNRNVLLVDCLCDHLRIRSSRW